MEALKDVPNKIEQVLNVLQEYWGVPYPLPKLDCVALPNYQAVKPADNWGLIFFKYFSYLNIRLYVVNLLLCYYF